MNVPPHGKRYGSSIVRAAYSVRGRLRWVLFEQQSGWRSLIPTKQFPVQPNGGITMANP